MTTRDRLTVEPRMLVALFALTVFAHAAWAGLQMPREWLLNGDGYVRALRVETLWQGGGWFDNSIARTNTPFGDTSHWTRPLDVLISLLALPLAPLLSVKKAIFWGSALSGPILHGATVAALVWAVWPFVGRTVAIFAGVMAVAQPGVLTFAKLTSADHHILIALLLVFGFGFAVRGMPREGSATAPSAAGICVALAFWVSTESFVFAALCLGTLGLVWLSGDDDSTAPKAGRFAVAFAASLAAATLIERGVAGFGAVEHDRISVVHVVLGVEIAVFFLIVRWIAARGRLKALHRRWLVATLGGASVSGIWLALFPKAIRGPLADVDLGFYAMMIERTEELQPAYASGAMSAYLAGLAVAIPWAAWRCRKKDKEFWFWLFLAIVTSAFALLTFFMARWVLFLGLFASVALADLAIRVLGRLGRTAFAAVLMSPQATVALGLFFGHGPAMKDSPMLWSHNCPLRPLTMALAAPPWGERPRVILINSYAAPDILYWTPHSVIGSMLVRNETGFLDTLAAFAAESDETAREIVFRRLVDAVVVCPAIDGGIGNDGKSTFSRRLSAGLSPFWLREANLSPEADGIFRIYDVLPEGRGR